MRRFFDAIRPLFGGRLSRAQVDGLNLILASSDGHSRASRAYMLATAFHETGRTMEPVRETFAASDGEAVARLEQAWDAGDLPWVDAPYWRADEGGQCWFGRGYVQLTHKHNYARASRELRLDLTDDPSLALDPQVAAEVLVRGCADGWFTGAKLSDYLPGDYYNARRVVNGIESAAKVARYAEVFEEALAATPNWAPSARPVPPTGIFASVASVIRRWSHRTQ